MMEVNQPKAKSLIALFFGAYVQILDFNPFKI